MREFVSIHEIVIHHSASSLSTRVENIRRWHTERGFTDVGYHYVVEEGGLIRWGRDTRVQGAHAKGANAGSIGICVVGDNTQLGAQWTELQWHSLRRLVNGLLAIHDLVRDSVRTHSEVGTTETGCPGMTGDELRKRLFSDPVEVTAT